MSDDGKSLDSIQVRRLANKECGSAVSLAFLLHTALAVTAWSLATLWSVHAVVVAVGLRRLPSLLKPSMPAAPPAGTSVAVIVPACNEQQTIAACLSSLLQQDWPNLHIVAVDDRSTDTTGQIMDALTTQHPDRLSIIHITSLPEGWLGKTHAMAVAARHAKATFQPKWLLFTDGDVLFHPECLRRSLALAEFQHADHFITAPTAVVHTFGEGMIMAFLQVIGLWGARLWRVADPSTRDAIGIGAFNLLRTSAYDHVGGFERLRLQVLEDLALGRLVKDAGLRQRVALAPHFVRIHWAAGIRGVLNTMTKNLFAIFQFRLLLVMLTCCGLSIVCLGPFVGLFLPETRIPSLLTLAAIATLYVIANRRLTRLPILNCVVFPVAATLFVYAILRSAAVTLAHGGVSWRGTFYPLKTLRSQALKLR